jgi:hypothetical protein
MGNISRRLASIATSVLFVAGAGCLEFRGVGPEDVTPEQPPRLVTVTIEYRQANVCQNAGVACTHPVVFFASWMRPGTEFNLTPDPDTFVYRGVAVDVPVNFPPRGEAYRVKVFDPYLSGTPSGGFEAMRLKIGGEALVSFGDLNTPTAHANVYIDENGIGHNPF